MINKYNVGFWLDLETKKTLMETHTGESAIKMIRNKL